MEGGEIKVMKVTGGKRLSTAEKKDNGEEKRKEKREERKLYVGMKE